MDGGGDDSESIIMAALPPHRRELNGAKDFSGHSKPRILGKQSIDAQRPTRVKIARSSIQLNRFNTETL